MIVGWLPTTIRIRQESKGVRAANLLVQDFSSFAFLLPWGPGYGQTD